jgi:hypothetical protein
VRLHPRDVLPLEPDVTGAGLDETGDQIHQAGLAGPVGADDAHDLALVEIEADPIDRFDPTEGLVQVLDL